VRTFAITSTLAVLVLSACPVMADIVTLSPNQDAFTSSQYPTTSYGASPDLYIGKGTYWDEGFFRGYLQFDLAGLDEITSASLMLYQYDTAPAAGGLPCDLHRVLAP
jgi:hypothetical protein